MQFYAYMSTKQRLFYSFFGHFKNNSNSKCVSFQIKSNQSEHEGVRKDIPEVLSSVDSFFLTKTCVDLIFRGTTSDCDILLR